MLSKPAQLFALIAVVTTLLVNVSAYGVTVNQSGAPTAGPTTVKQTPDNPGQKSQTAGVCGDGAGTPCVNLLAPGATVVSGKAASGATIELQMSGKKIASTTALQDGTFAFTVDALSKGTKVEVDQTAPTVVTMGPFTVGATGICDADSAIPCLDRPEAGAKVVTGKATADATIDLKVDGKKVASTTTLKDGTFQFAVDALSQGSKVEADQTSPSTATLGPVTVGQRSGNSAAKPQATGICGDSPTPPCFNQPVSGAKAITGKATATASLDLKLDSKKVASTTALQDGTFQFVVDALGQNVSVEVDQTAPAAVTMGPVSIGTNGICDNTSVKPCLNQPMAGAKTVTGKATSGASIDLKVGGKKIGSTNALKDDTFQFAVDGLTLGAEVEADQTAPSSVTMGPVTTKSNGICSADSGTPCMKQPVAGDKAVSGKAATGASITVKVKQHQEGTTTADTNSNFRFERLDPLEAGAEVEANQTAPTPVTMGPTNVRDNRICGKSTQIPCVDQPEAGATKITGKAKTGASVDVIIDDKKVGTGTGNSDNQFAVSVDALKLGSSVEADQTAPETVAMGPVAVIPSPAASSLYTLGLVGLNATGSSTSGPKAQYFAEFDVISPLHWAGRACWSPLKQNNKIVQDPDGNPVHEDKVYPLAGRCWIWLNPRVASAPETASTALTSVSSASSLTQPIGAQTIGQITQTFEFQAGLEYYVIKPWNGALFGSGHSWAKTSLSLILGGGTLTPFNSISTASEYGLNNNLGKQFNQSVTANPNQNLSQIYPVLAGALCNFGFTGSSTVTCPTPPVTGIKTAAFVFPNRSRFYRDYYGGFRIRTFYFSGSCQTQPNGLAAGPCRSANVYPGTFDVRLGQDETVTGGFLRGVVLTLTGSYPLPGTDGTVRIFGSSYLRLHKNANTTALVMVPSQSFTSLDDPSVVVQQIRPSDQDYYRLGLGVDLVPLIRKWYTASQSTTTTTK